jgi:O-antigen ligase/polysaccharide polymerase Wzy-like membrane protein
MRLSARGIAAFGAVALCLGNVGRIPTAALGGRSTPLVVADVVVASVWVCLLFAATLGRGRVVIDDVMSATFAFLAAAVVSTGLAFSRYNLSITDGAGVAAFLIRWIAYFGWYPFVVWCLTPNESRDAWRYMERALLVFAIAGIVQSAFFPGFAQMIHDGGDLPTWDVQGRRLVSSMLDPNFAGVLIVIALLFRLARVAESMRESGLTMVALGTALLLTVSRSSILALVVGLAVLAGIRGLRLRLFRTLFVGTILILPFLSLLLSFAGSFNKLRYDASAAQRLIPWIRAGRLVQEHPWFGVGFNAIKQAQESHGWRAIGGADVSFDGGLIFVAAMTGVVGLFLYVRLLVRVARGARRVWNDGALASVDRAHATATAAATAAVIVHSFFVNSLLLPFVMQILWVMWGRLAHVRAARRAKLGLAVAIPLALVTSCDPCAGTIGCTTTPHVTIAGTIVNHVSGAPISGARLVVRVATTGAAADASTTTDAQGLWEVNIATADEGAAAADITVTAPQLPAYTVSGISVRASRRSGDATALGLWTDIPFVRHLATVVHLSSPLAGAQVHFAIASGPTLVSSQTDGTTNSAGVFELDFTAHEVGRIVGDLTVTHVSLPRPLVVHNYSIPLDYRFGIPEPSGTIGRGRQLQYGGELIFRGTGAKAPGVTVEFQRTGGIATLAERASATTNATGFFLIDMSPASDEAVGDVIGDLTFRPPTAAATTYRNVHLATYDSTFIRSMGLWAYGERWAWTLELWRNDSLKPSPGTRVQFTRTGGLAISPSTIDGTTASNGRVELRASVLDTGVVEGRLTVIPTVGPQRAINGIRLRTNADEDLHFGGIVSYGPALRYVGEVLTPDGAPVVGARVLWTQTSGIPATPATLDSTTDKNGRFPLTLYPSADGGVIGRVRVRPPPPWPAGAEYVFENLRLDSFESSELKLAVTYRIPRP